MSIKTRSIITIIITAISILCILPNFERFNWLRSGHINLGLDLKGGVHLLMQADFHSYLAEQLNHTSDTLKKDLRAAKIGYKDFKISNQQIQFNVRDDFDASVIRKIIKNIDSSFLIENFGQTFSVSFSEDKKTELLNRVLDLLIETIRIRVDSSGTKEPIIQRQGDDKILVQVPGETDPERLKSIIGKTAKLSFHMLNENVDYNNVAKAGIVPEGSMILYGGDNSSREKKYAVVVYSRPEFAGDLLKSAYVTFDQFSNPAISFSLNDKGAKIFAEVTKNNVGKRLAIVLDNKVLSAPVINQPILGGNGMISGNFTIESAEELALLLRTGALVAPMHIVEERSIGPSLGADSIEAGKKAGIIGFIAVAIFMIWSYGILGVFSIIALSLALLYIFCLLSLLNVTLTFPGIAGLILTMGMAVDANVLIYERIREEILIHKNTLLNSIRHGFESAFATIADSNITTMIAGILLYIFGSGAIKGFAVTLSIGIISSMFAAIIITKLLIELWIKYYKPRSLKL